jgi:Domain of unknown function (DUF4349)
MTIRILLAASLVLVVVGCGGEPGGQNASALQDFSKRAPMTGEHQRQKANVGGGVPAPDGEAKPEAAIDRKIIRTADLRVIVDDFGGAEQGLRKIIAGCKNCYVASAEVGGSAGAPRQGRWKVRVPVAEFDTFLDAVAGLGVPERNSVDSQDVTEEYYDLDTRVKNKKVEEQRLLKHLEKSTGKLEDILAVEREISRVRGEIEQQEGRLRLLANLTALTTVTITIQEIKNYVPPQTPTFTATIGETFTGSVDVLIAFGKRLVLVAAALTPWLPLLIIIGLAVWLSLRRSSRRSPALHPPAQ